MPSNQFELLILIQNLYNDHYIFFYGPPFAISFHHPAKKNGSISVRKVGFKTVKSAIPALCLLVSILFHVYGIVLLRKGRSMTEMALDSRIWTWFLMILMSLFGFIEYCMWILAGLDDPIYFFNELVKIKGQGNDLSFGTLRYDFTRLAHANGPMSESYVLDLYVF